MPCFHPLPAWRNDVGIVTLREPAGQASGAVLPGTFETLRLPCGSCIGCRTSRAREWALRCGLELQAHATGCWTTLTYDDAHLPSTLQKSHLSQWVKRLRRRVSPVPIRFFASGEYGERTFRPHYHAILFGLPATAAAIVQDTWPHGFARTDELSGASIAYVAGYCSKKVGWRLESGERLDYSTGELYEYQAPFILMSRRPGIAAAARSYWQSWRSFAIYSDSPIPVPRFLHNSWLSHASPSQLSLLMVEKQLASSLRDTTRERLLAAEAISYSQHSLSSSSRTTL